MEKFPKPGPKPLAETELEPATAHIYKIGDEVTWPASDHKDSILIITAILAVPITQQKFTGHPQRVALKDSIGPFAGWITAAHLIPVEKEEDSPNPIND